MDGKAQRRQDDSQGHGWQRVLSHNASACLLVACSISAVLAPVIAERLDSSSYLVVPDHHLQRSLRFVRSLRRNVSATTFVVVERGLVQAHLDIILPIAACALAVLVAVVQHFASCWLIGGTTTSRA